MYATANVLVLAVVFCLSVPVELQQVSIHISYGGITPVVGVSYNLTCNVSDSASVATYRWLKDGEQINTTEQDTLVLPPLNLTDIGNYTCEVEINSTNYSANNIISISALQSVYMSLNGRVYPNNSFILITEIGTSLNPPPNSNNGLQCVTNRRPCCSSRPTRAGEWYFPGDGGVVPRIGSGDTMATDFYRNRGDNGTVNLNRLNDVVMPTGQFCCEIPDATDTNVTVCAEIVYISVEDDGTTPVVGQNYSLSCAVYGTNTTNQWRRDGSVISGETELTFSPLRLSDAGQYSCGNGELFSDIKINLKVPTPTVNITSNQTGIITAGSSVTLTCNVELSPLVDVPVNVNTVWTGPDNFNSNMMAQQMGSTTTYTSTVMVSSFGRDQSGDYTCTATVSSNTSLVLNESDAQFETAYITTGVYLLHNGSILSNNSNVFIDNIGTTSTTNSVMCVSDKKQCCNQPHQYGEWYLPDHSTELTNDSGTFRYNRDNNGSVDLFRADSDITTPTGRFCCHTVDASDNYQTLCINIFSIQISNMGNTMTGESYDLNCSVSEVAVTRYRWTKRGNNTYSNQSLLSFPSLILSDAGEYTCEVEVDSRNYSRMTTITLQIPNPIISVTITSDPVSPLSRDSTTVTLTCTVVLSPSVDVPVTVNIEWTGPLIDNYITGTEQQDSNYTGRTTIDPFTRESSGNYTCTATVMTEKQIEYVSVNGGKESHSTLITIIGVYISHNSTVLPNDSYVNISEIVAGRPLVCHTDNLQQTCNQGDWYSPNSSRIMQNKFFVNRPTDKCTVSLHRTEQLPSDDVEWSYLIGRFCCIIPNYSGMNQKVCIISVPSISISGLDGIPTAGQNYTLTCNTSINNAKFDTYCWIKDNVTLNTTASNSSILRFSPLLLSDGGHYYCGININVEYFSVEHQLKIKIPAPASVLVVSSKRNPIGCNVTLNCIVELSPAAIEPSISLLMVDIQLFKDENPLNSTGSVVANATIYTYRTQIISFQLNDTGNYSCTATIRSRSQFIIDSDNQSYTLQVTTGVYLSLNEEVIVNNSNIPITMIGMGDSEALHCFTDLYQLSINNSGTLEDVGEWYFPNGSVVVAENGDIYTTRGDRVVRLHVKDNVTMPAGKYHCDILDANRTNQSIYVNIYIDPVSGPSTTTSDSTSSSTPGLAPTSSSTPGLAPTSSSTTVPAAPFPAESAAAGATVGGILLAIIIVGVVLAILIILRRRNKEKGSFQVTELEYIIQEDNGSVEPNDVPSPEVEVESKEEQLTQQEVAVESRDEQSAHVVAVESKSEWLTEDQPDAPEEGKREAIELTEHERIRESPSEELKSSEDKSEDEETTSLNSVCEYGKVVPLSEFTKHVESFHADRDKLFEMEYTSISRLPQLHVSVAKIPHNKLKNRFGNIFPYDDTRVKLQEIDGEEGSDYINANYLDGYEKPKAYIAAQGPMPNTVNDFWRMVWEYKLSTIVMLTRCFEGRVKCEAYWPTSIGERKDIGHNLIVNLISELPFAEYYIRKMTVTHTDGTTMDIVQYHFIGWPDHGVPMNGIGLINFIKRVRKLHPYSEPRPLLVHCSAGVGRTGAFIVLDSMMERMKSEDTLNIYEFVNHLRTQRVLMVQTQVQYNFIHDVLNEMILTGNTEILATNFRIVMKQLNSVRDGESGYSKQLRIIGQVVPKPSEAEYTNASRDNNRSKNRYQNVLPSDHYRVMLRAMADFDYINASFIDGYRQRGAYIATQIPLKNTVNDFWKMVCEYQTRSIVVLCKMEEDVETYQNFLPESEDRAEAFGKVIVKVLSKKAMADYEVRQVELSHDNSPDKMEVSVFHYLSWNKDGTLEGKPTLLELIEQVNKKQMGSGNRPITVVCNDGIGRTGTFISIHAQLERLKTEGVVDFFQFVKSARFQRAGIVPEVNHYTVCHHVVAEYLDKFEIYANFKEIV